MNSMRSELTPFLDGDERLRSFPAKHKKKLLALWYLAGKVEAGRQYTEAELNELLNAWTLFHDPATLRRELYNKRLLERTPDGGRYWRAEPFPGLQSLSRAMFEELLSRQYGLHVRQAQHATRLLRSAF